MARLERATHQFALTASAQERADLATFTASQNDWLADYALFMTLADAHGWRDSKGWSGSIASEAKQGFK